jgi:ribulose-bisphosphate carboxylase large chain
MACGVLKPMGLSVNKLASLAKQFAEGGIDFIKDDHGLANQTYTPFKERVEKVVKAVSQVANQAGRKTRYFPNITASGTHLLDNYKFAAECGADGVMIIPGLCGFEMMHQLAKSEIDLPIIAHPAFTGTMVTDHEHGFSPAFLYGELFRALGADFSIYPNTGGRFSFSEIECHQINNAARKNDSTFKPIFPMPGGGMQQEKIPYWLEKYGPDTVFLLGASILQHKEGLQQAVRNIQQTLENTKF